MTTDEEREARMTLFRADMAQMSEQDDDPSDWSVVGIVAWGALLCLALGAAVAAVVLP